MSYCAARTASSIKRCDSIMVATILEGTDVWGFVCCSRLWQSGPQRRGAGRCGKATRPRAGTRLPRTCTSSCALQSSASAPHGCTDFAPGRTLFSSFPPQLTDWITLNRTHHAEPLGGRAKRWGESATLLQAQSTTKQPRRRYVWIVNKLWWIV